MTYLRRAWYVAGFADELVPGQLLARTLAKCLQGVDLAQRDALAHGLARYDRQRVADTNKNAKMARHMGYLFHRTPWPLSVLRDAVFDHTRFLEAMLVESYLKDAETQMETLPISAH